MNKILAALNKERGTKSGRLPSKRSMNLYVKVKDGNSWQVILPLAIFLTLVVLCIYRLGVVDRLNKLNNLQQENAHLESQLNTLNEQLKGYNGLEQEYRRYTTAYLREEERGLMSRTLIFEMLEECTEGIANITDVSIEGNQVGLNVNAMVSLEDIDIIQDRLKAMPNVDEIKLSNASGINTVDVKGYIVFTVKEDDAGNESGASESASYGAAVNTEELAARLKGYTDSAADARTTKEALATAGSSHTAGGSQADGASEGQGTAARNTGSSILASQGGNASQGTGSTATQGSTAAGANTAAGAGVSGSSASAGASSGAVVQNINGDEVVILPEGVAIYGFDSIAEGQAQMQGAGQ